MIHSVKSHLFTFNYTWNKIVVLIFINRSNTNMVNLTLSDLILLQAISEQLVAFKHREYSVKFIKDLSVIRQRF